MLDGEWAFASTVYRAAINGAEVEALSEVDTPRAGDHCASSPAPVTPSVAARIHNPYIPPCVLSPDVLI